MKRWPVITAGVAGAAVGVFVVVAVNADAGFGSPALTQAITMALLVLCPVANSLWWGNWAPPILNGLLYAGVAFGIAKWRSVRKAGTGMSN